MEPARLRAMLARTPGLLARHLSACLTDGPGAVLPADLPARLLSKPLSASARAWLERPNHHLIDADLYWIKANGAQILCSSDAGFPPDLARWEAAPATLYACGALSALGSRLLAIVGSRQPTPAGIQTAREFARDLAGARLGITSGLGTGIDTAAHEAALDATGSTIGVCAGGLDQIYPACSAALAARIRACGCLVSPFAPGTPPRRHHFPIRSRLIGALSSAVLVIETARGDGALLSAEQARRLHRPLFAIPGSIRDPAARRCNELIRAGATLVTHARDILPELAIEHANQKVIKPAGPAAKPVLPPAPLDNKYEMLLDAAGFEPVDIDVLAFRTGWSGHDVASMLLFLELRGRIAPQPGGRYCRLS